MALPILGDATHVQCALPDASRRKEVSDGGAAAAQKIRDGIAESETVSKQPYVDLVRPSEASRIEAAASLTSCSRDWLKASSRFIAAVPLLPIELRIDPETSTRMPINNEFARVSLVTAGPWLPVAFYTNSRIANRSPADPAPAFAPSLPGRRPASGSRPTQRDPDAAHRDRGAPERAERSRAIVCKFVERTS